jgi:uncharacterized protein (TIGR02246 family)
MFALILTLNLLYASSQDPAAASVTRFYREWSADTAKNGAEGYAAHFAADATLLPPDGPPVAGRDRIKAWMASQADLPYRTQPEAVNQDEIRIMGDIAIVRTTLRGKRVSKVDGKETPFETKYLDVLRRTPAGGWEFLTRMWNSNISGATAARLDAHKPHSPLRRLVPEDRVTETTGHPAA